MTVKELRAILANTPDHWRVILAADAEGNQFSPLAETNPGQYSPNSTWSGEFIENHAHSNAFCLWPVN